MQHLFYCKNKKKKALSHSDSLAQDLSFHCPVLVMQLSRRSVVCHSCAAFQQSADLHTGSLLWKADRTPADLYLAGVPGGKVLVVGRDGCRALRLADGKEAWRLATEPPSGHCTNR